MVPFGHYYWMRRIMVVVVVVDRQYGLESFGKEFDEVFWGRIDETLVDSKSTMQMVE